MRCKKEIMLLYAVTDRSWIGKQTLMEQVEAALKGGATCIQLREKELDENAFLEEAIEMKQLCKAYGVPFIINDNVEIAIKCKADGIHVGQQDMEVGKVRTLLEERIPSGDTILSSGSQVPCSGNKEMMIGVSVQTVEQAIAAEAAGADYLGVGAVFPTATKADACEVSHQMLKEICAAVQIPVVAIGGINKNNMLQLSGSGVDGVALVSAIFAAKDIEEECKHLKKLASEMTAT